MEILQPESIIIDRSTIRDFDEAFNNIKPKISTLGNNVFIRRQDEEHTFSLSMPTRRQGFTR